MPDQKTEGPEALFLGSVDRSLLLATILIAALALLATWMLTRRITEPIEELRAAARNLAGGNLGRRVDTRGSDEIAELGRSFNARAAELEKVQGLRRNLVHDVVHELRTPLAALTPTTMESKPPRVRRFYFPDFRPLGTSAPTPEKSIHLFEWRVDQELCDLKQPARLSAASAWGTIGPSHEVF